MILRLMFTQLLLSKIGFNNVENSDRTAVGIDAFPRAQLTLAARGHRTNPRTPSPFSVLSGQFSPRDAMVPPVANGVRQHCHYLFHDPLPRLTAAEARLFTVIGRQKLLKFHRNACHKRNSLLVPCVNVIGHKLDEIVVVTLLPVLEELLVERGHFHR